MKQHHYRSLETVFGCGGAASLFYWYAGGLTEAERRDKYTEGPLLTFCAAPSPWMYPEAGADGLERLPYPRAWNTDNSAGCLAAPIRGLAAIRQ
jgi:hypothetical protein